jgi:hypothetical protein
MSMETIPSPRSLRALAQNLDSHVLTIPTVQEHQDLKENARVQAVQLILKHGTMPSPSDLTAPDQTYSQPATASHDEVA